MGKFILNRTDDCAYHSTWWILGYALLFWLVSRIVAMGLVMGCTAIYASFGINPESLMAFAGDPNVARGLGERWKMLLTVALLAPVIEECVFRLGLSFKRWQVALALAFIPIMAMYSHWQWTSTLISIGIGALIFGIVFFCTRRTDWDALKGRWLVPAIWITSILFGLVHLLAFKGLTLELLPYALCFICIPMFGGFSCAYLRVNISFPAAVAFHIFNNLPAILVMLK